MSRQIIVDSLVRIPYECGWVDFDLLKDLYTTKGRDGKEFKIYQEDEENRRLLLPRKALNSINEFEVNDQRTRGRPVLNDWESRIDWREGQEDTVKKVMKRLVAIKGGILVAGCGKGKTAMATELALISGLSTCVIVHQEFLEDQWLEAVDMLSDYHTVGQLRQDVCDTGFEKDIVIASVQSLTAPKRKYPPEFFKSFGLLICDEVHRYAADVWQHVFGMFPAMYRLGLTATADRYDGLWRVITDHIGQIAAELDVDPIESKVYMITVDTDIPEDDWNKPWLDDNMKRGKLVSLLANHMGRNKVVARNILKTHAANRKTIILSERRIQLDILAKMLMEEKVPKDHIGFFVGGKKKEALNEAKKKPLIFCTYHKAKEGLDIETLDTLVLATPQYDIRQSQGRLLRELEGKAMPVTIDFVDHLIDKLRGQAFGRLKQYNQMKCIVDADF